MGKVVIPWLMVAIVPMIAAAVEQRALGKRNAPANLDYPDYSTKYDEYPVSKQHSPMRFSRAHYLTRTRNVYASLTNSCEKCGLNFRFLMFQSRSRKKEILILS